MQDRHLSGSGADRSASCFDKRRRAELLDGLKQGALIGAAVLALAWPLVPFEAPDSLALEQADFAGERASSEVRYLARWVLTSPDPQAHRISYGCINLPAAFFDTVVYLAFYQRRGVVYVLPEVKPFSLVFAAASELVAAR